MREGFTPLEIKEMRQQERCELRLSKGGLSLTGPVRNISYNENVISNGVGFTLVELLLAISIFAIVAVVISSTFGMGINAWKKMDGVLVRYQEVRLLLERMGWELRNCVDMDMENFNVPDSLKDDFRGEKNKLIFFTVRENGIKKVTYQKKNSEDTDVFSLERGEENFATNPPPQESQGDTALDILDDIQFKYLYLKKGETEMAWHESLEGEDAKKLPSQVGIRLTFYVPTGKEKPDQKEYQKVTVDKYADIPSAPKK